jgi:DNA-binding XRE family transcriptional regulator
MYLHFVTLSMEQNKPKLEALEAHRKWLGMKQSELCEKLNIETTTYYRWRKEGTTAKNEKRVHDVLRKFADIHTNKL